MKVILLEEIPGLGELGAVVRVKDGFARNFLLPRRKADRATKAAVEEFERRRAELEERQRAQVAALENARAALDGGKIQITAKAGPDGGLYGSVTPAMVAAAVNRVKPEGIPDIAKGQVHMPDGHLKHLGDAEVEVALRPGLRARVIVAVLPEAAAETAAPAKPAARERSAQAEAARAKAAKERADADKLKSAVLAAADSRARDDDAGGPDHLQKQQEQE